MKLSVPAIALSCVALLAVGVGVAQADDPDQVIVQDYVTVANLVSEDQSMDVYCDFENGWVATGGGVASPNQSTYATWVVFDTYPILYDGDAIGWHGQVKRVSGSTNSYSASMRTYAICEPAAE